MSYYHSFFDSPIGRLRLVVHEGERLVGLLWEQDRLDELFDALNPRNKKVPLLDEVERQLGEYFRGARRVFNLPIQSSGTRFQCVVWDTLRDIPYGETWSYSQLSIAATGSPKACRAVGLANGRNPISIIVPCHRVVGKNGALSGFAGGADKKRFLLELEGAGQSFL